MSLKFSWFPGHMQKTLRKLQEEEKMVSMVLMVLDSRCPRSSRNPNLENIFRRKPILYIMNKEDLASIRITRQWMEHLSSEGLNVLSLSARAGTGRRKLLKAIKDERKEFAKKVHRQVRASVFRILVAGIPNVGKSSIINMLSPQKSVRTGKKPGITLGAQWLKIEDGLEVLDSPGVMVPRMDLADTPWILGATAAIKQEILPIEQVAYKFVEYLLKKDIFPKDLLPDEISDNPDNVLESLAFARGFVDRGGTPDIEKTSLHLLKIFREGRLGRISLEAPDDEVVPMNNNEEKLHEDADLDNNFD
jgi:ribosome biogenesis GTPase A